MSRSSKLLKKLKISKRFADILKYTALILIVSITVGVRLFPLKWGPYLQGYDPYFQYRVTEYIVKNGFASWFTWHDTMSWYPRGRDIYSTSYPGVPFTGAAAYFLAKIFGFNVTLMELCELLPPILAGITAIFIYLIGREIEHEKVGLLAALFLGTVPAFIGRTTAGFYDTEAVGFPAMIISLYFWVRAMNRESIISAILSGVALAYMSISWGGSVYLINLYAAYAIIMVLIGKYSRKLLIIYSITMGVGLLLSAQIIEFARKYLISYATILPTISMLTLSVLDVLKNTKTRKMKIAGLLIFTLIIAGSIIVLDYMGYLHGLTGRILSVINPYLRSSMPLVESVAEHRTPSWGYIYYEYGLLILFSAIGIYYLLKRGRDNDILIAVGGVTSIYFSATMIRLVMLAAPFVSILSAVALAWLIKPHIDRILGRVMIIKRRRIPETAKTGSILLLTVLTIVTIIPTISWRNVAESPQTIVTSGIPVMTEYPDWMEALLWMRNNLPDNAIVASWWDYGYWITTLGNKTTIIDNATLDEKSIKKIALAFMSNETEALKIFKELGVTHVVVYEAFDPETGFLLHGRGWGDFAKSYWMINIAGLNVSDYLVYQKQQRTYLPLGPKAANATLYRLIFNTRSSQWTSWGINIPKPENFELVFSSSNGYVFIYKVKYNG